MDLWYWFSPGTQVLSRGVCVCLDGLRINSVCMNAARVTNVFLCVFRWFGGLFLDIKRKLPTYLSDYTDACSLQCVASFLFLYCACMSPVITFGGLLGEATEGRIVNPSLSCWVLQTSRSRGAVLTVTLRLFSSSRVPSSRCLEPPWLE